MVVAEEGGGKAGRGSGDADADADAGPGRLGGCERNRMGTSAMSAKLAGERSLDQSVGHILSTWVSARPGFQAVRGLDARQGGIHGAGMTRQQVLDLYFMDARCKLIEIAAFLDRVDRGTGEPDFRLAAFRKAMEHLAAGESGRASAVLTELSDPTEAPVERAEGKGAVGAWPGMKVA